MSFAGKDVKTGGGGRGRGGGGGGGRGGAAAAAGRGAGGAGATGGPEKKMKRNNSDDGDDGDDGYNDEEMEAGEEGKDGFVDLSKGGEKAWARPALPPINPKTDSICFQQLDTDYLVGTTPTTMKDVSPANGAPLTHDQRSAIVRLYGVTDKGNSVLCYVHGFMPYFYIPCWSGFTANDMRCVADTLNHKLGIESRERNLHRCVTDCRVVKKQSIWGYHFGEMADFLKITVAVPSLVATARGYLSKGMTFNNVFRSFETYESNLLYVLRFMVDKKIMGGSWLELKGATYKIRSDQLKKSYCQLEIDVHTDSVIAHEPVGDWMKIAPMRILSFDIECAGRKGHFPTPDVDPVIQIANVLAINGQKTPIAKNVFTLNTCASIVGAQVISHQKEEDMLNEWKKFLLLADPDVITGYNIVNFDLPYLLDRARHLAGGTSTSSGKRKVAAKDEFPYLGRIFGSQTTIKDTTFNSKAYGKRENKEIKIEGRIQFDLLQVIRREYKLRSYTLNAVCAYFLNQQKEDVHYSIITDLQNGTDETRRRLAVYCLKDAYLPLRLMEKLMLMVNFVEMARVTGVPISLLLTRGQQIKVVTQLYRKANQHNLVIPVKDKVISEDKYEGATVLEPKCAFYDIPIATLDFASLYPSIMQAHNLCYSTWISAANAAKLKPEQVEKTPTGDLFVSSKVATGILPEILTELLAARSNAKKLMKTEKDPFAQAVLNGRQLALKISANSVYGFTGAQVGQLPCLAISGSVTAFGRQMIEHTKKVVEEKYTIANGFPHNADVVYGDTDSVMVKFGVSTVTEAMALGRQAAEAVSKEFMKPIKLEFEKVYYPYLLMNKKRYAGLYWTNDKKHDRMDTKGIETVRRDNCPLVATVVTTCLNKILIDRSIEGAIEYTQGVIADLLQNKLDLSLLVISKSLGKSATSEGYSAKQAHVELAERMRKRDPQSAPGVGDRVAYVITKTGGKGAQNFEKAEDPIWVLENDLPIDTDYYLEKQLKAPLGRIFEPVMKDLKKLFSGEHTRKIKMSTNQSGAMMKFAKKIQTCMSCKAPLKDGTKSTVCVDCAGKQAELYVEQIEKTRAFEELYSRVWTQCQRCQGSLHQDVLCTSRDCPIFYRRKKVQKDLQDSQKALDRFTF